MLGFIATHTTRLDCALVDAPHSLLVQSRKDLEGFSHADGWGIAQWGEDGASIMRHLAGAHEGEDYREFARTVRARQAIAHVRQATAGDVSFQNTHPFVDGPWVFVHNGTIRHFREGVRDVMWGETSRDHRQLIQGNTDSEALFALLLTRLENRPDADAIVVIADTIRDAAAWCADAGPCEDLGLNVIMSDGHRILGARWQQTLWLLQREGVKDAELCDHADDGTPTPADYRALLIASEPLTAEEWRPVPERSVLELTAPPGGTAVRADIRTIASTA